MVSQNDDTTRARRGALVSMLLPFLALTLIGGGAGGFFGFFVLGSAPASKEQAQSEIQGAEERAHAPQEGRATGRDKGKTDTATAQASAHPPNPPSMALLVKELPPVVANLAGKAGKLVRLQGAIVYDPHELPQIEPLVAALMSDLTAFISTLELAAIEGPDGLRRLQEELNERAATRSERRIREFIIEALVIQ
jgi:flagellar FliL protein